MERISEIGITTDTLDFLLSGKNNYTSYKKRKRFVIEEPEVENKHKETCEICCETLSEADLKQVVCVCSAKTCLRCIHKLRTTGDGNCPFCRREYSAETVENVMNGALEETPRAVSGPCRMRTDRSDSRRKANNNMPKPAWMQRIEDECERTMWETQGQDATVQTRNEKKINMDYIKKTYPEAIGLTKLILKKWEESEILRRQDHYNIVALEAIAEETMQRWEKLQIMVNWRETRCQMAHYNKIVAEMFGQISMDLRNLEKEHCKLAADQNLTEVAIRHCVEIVEWRHEVCPGLPSALAALCEPKKARQKLKYCVEIMQKRRMR
jgi:hypothetical protein